VEWTVMTQDRVSVTLIMNLQASQTHTHTHTHTNTHKAGNVIS